MSHISPLEKLIEAFRGLPGIGPKLAIKLAYYIVECEKNYLKQFIIALKDAKIKIRFCEQCFNFTDEKLCRYCSSNQRKRNIICVVEQPRDLIYIEKTHEYKGLYHVLHGALSPLAGITPNDLKLKELLERLQSYEVKVSEIIMATNQTVEGEATAMYISRLLKPLNIKVTRLAHGLPMGGDIEFADEATLAKAFENRKEII